MNQAKIPELLETLGGYLPNYKHRPGQLQMAEAVAGAMKDRHNLVVEGGTGIGKSMAYLVPALLSIVEDGARVLIATSHKPLQDQIAKKIYRFSISFSKLRVIPLSKPLSLKV